MSLARIGMSVAGVVGLLAATLAAATIWLLLTDPVTVADAVSEQEVTPFLRELATVIYQALRQLVRYL
jgi:ABC-type cobalamin/Fe3+-siderophores transport system ATPase subunit